MSGLRAFEKAPSAIKLPPSAFPIVSLIFGQFPNIAGTGVGLATNNNGYYNYSHWSGVFTPVGDAWGGYERATDQTNKDFGTQFNMYASRSNAIYGAADTVHPNSLRSYCLIRYM